MSNASENGHFHERRLVWAIEIALILYIVGLLWYGDELNSVVDNRLGLTTVWAPAAETYVVSMSLPFASMGDVGYLLLRALTLRVKVADRSYEAEPSKAGRRTSMSLQPLVTVNSRYWVMCGGQDCGRSCCGTAKGCPVGFDLPSTAFLLASLPRFGHVDVYSHPQPDHLEVRN